MSIVTLPGGRPSSSTQSPDLPGRAAATGRDSPPGLGSRGGGRAPPPLLEPLFGPGVVAPATGAGLAPRATLEAVVEVGAFTAPFNMSGFPAVSIPVGRTRAGLPIGAQLVMRRGQDGPLLALAAALEAAGLWRSLPPAGLSSKSEP